MPLTAGANFISGGLGLIGGLFGSSSASKAAKYAANKQYQAVQETNAMNYKIAQESNQLNEQMFHEANDFNKSERLATQEYNSAAQQRARLEAAGLNPYLMMSGGSAGTAQNATSAADWILCFFNKMNDQHFLLSTSNQHIPYRNSPLTKILRFSLFFI